jgi:hypothetical protein
MKIRFKIDFETALLIRKNRFFTTRKLLALIPGYPDNSGYSVKCAI